ncbi:uncharacterized protein LOC135390665 [Ornithodoros turicata]|uniref:uncharacterized protein LOC135390665 n=1 Tax=Ornithodoros turicata TaxID=34597 RepID=UPI003138EAF6
MKKYTQLALIVISILSVLALLVCERRYANMKVIFEVMDVFEAKETAVKCDKRIETLRKADYSASARITPTVLPVWMEVLEGVYAYSAFWDFAPEYNKKISRVLVAFPKQGKNILKCFVWFDSTHFVEADDLRITVLAETSNAVSAVADCIVRNISIRPVGVSFSSSVSNKDAVKVVGLLPTTTNATSNVSVCLPPLSHATTPLQIAEFVIYHRHIGAQDFIVYDSGLLTNAKKLILAIPAMTDGTVSLLPWNVPLNLQSVTDIVRVADCLLRTKGRSNATIFLELNEFLALYKVKGLGELQRGLEAITPSPKENNPLVLFHRHYYCDEFSDDIVASSLEIPFVTQRKVRYHKVSEKHSVALVLPHFSVKLARDIGALDVPIDHNVLVPERSAVINVYRECGKLFPIHNTRDHYIPDMHMTKLRGVFFASKLYHYLEKQPFAQFLL